MNLEKITGYNGGLFSGETLKENIKFDETRIYRSLKIRDTVKDQSIFEDTYQKWNFKEYENIVEEKLKRHNEK